ncbi:unnamed protein product [Durusdinium trenchii]|uniref:Uncharacterized protein n=1 Tax=Durusdinium trenchii TaxID=1381693 RepID=A0ABP0R7M0_9DINO
MKLCFLLAVISTARKLVDPAPFPRGKLNAGIDLDGVEAMVLQLGNRSTPSMKPLFDDFRKLLQEELLPRLYDEKGTAKSLLEDAAKGFESCQGVDQSRVWRLSASHQRCRAQEAQLRRQQKDVCDMSTAMATNQHETCQAFQDLDVFPEGVPVVCNKEANDTSHEAHAKRVRDFYAQKVQAWAVAEGLCANQTARATQSAGDCKAAGASVVSKGENCTEIQRMLDDLACEAWTEHYDCEKKSVSCLFQARQRYLDANRTGARTDEDLQSQWRAVKRIECLLDAMEQSEDMNHALEECRSKSHDASPIALSYPFYQDWAPQMPDVSECKQPRFPPPGSATYPKQVYDLAQGESFAECTAECCSRCQFFTCNSTTVLKPNAKLLHGFSQAQCCEAMPQVHWRAEEWPNVNCPTECGLQTMTQTRRVVCWDVANQVEAEESLCTSTKPSSFRVSCPATPSCRSCQATKCPNGFTAKADAPEICTGATCLPEECCNRVCSVGDCPAGWVLKANATCGSATCTRGDCCSVTQWSFNEWTDVMCDSSCGQPEQIETRLVRCRVEGMVQGDVSFVRDDACVAPKPVTSRVGPALWFRGAAGRSRRRGR